MSVQSVPNTIPSPAPTVAPSWPAGAAALVVTAVLLTVSAFLQPRLGGSDTHRLAVLDDAGTRAVVSSVALTLAQLPMVAALLAIGRLLRRRSPKLAVTGVAIGVAGAFGESVGGGFSLVELVMARDEAQRAAYAHLLHEIDHSPLGVFSLIGLAGSVLGLLLLSIGIFRSRVAPRWVGPALWAFLALEYVGSTVTLVLGWIGVLAALAAFVALARETLRR